MGEPDAPPPSGSPAEPLRLEIKLNPNGVRTPLQRTLTEVADHAALGLHAIEAFHPTTKLMLPTTSFQFGFADPMAPLSATELSEYKDRFTTWILLSAFTAFIKGASASLKEAYLFNAISAKGPQINMTVQAFNEMLNSERVTADKLDLPTLLARVTRGLSAPLDLADHLLSFNAVRNCLEHRGGVVQPKDVTDPDAGALVLRWRRMKLFWNDAGAEVEIHVGAIVSGAIMMRVEERQKAFVLGERVALTTDEFAEAMFTANLLAQELAEKLPGVQLANKPGRLHRTR